MNVLFTGTNASIPNKNRNVSGIILKIKKDIILIDCGEGTQHQFLKIKGNEMKNIKIICITHLHYDHVGGLFGLLKTINQRKYTKSIKIFGPIGIKKLIDFMCKITDVRFEIELIINELNKNNVHCYNIKDLQLSCIPIEHRVVCFAYKFKFRDKKKFCQEKLYKKYNIQYPGLSKNFLQKNGLNNISYKDFFENNKFGLTKNFINELKNGNKVQFIDPKDVIECVKGKCLIIFGDTNNGNSSGYFNNYDETPDCIIHECTSNDSEIYKKGHSSPLMVYEFCKLIKPKRLIITHFSNRYKDPQILKDEIIKYGFHNVEVAKDFKNFLI